MQKWRTLATCEVSKIWVTHDSGGKWRFTGWNYPTKMQSSSWSLESWEEEKSCEISRDNNNKKRGVLKTTHDQKHGVRMNCYRPIFLLSILVAGIFFQATTFHHTWSSVRSSKEWTIACFLGKGHRQVGEQTTGPKVGGRWINAGYWRFLFGIRKWIPNMIRKPRWLRYLTLVSSSHLDFMKETWLFVWVSHAK